MDRLFPSCVYFNYCSISSLCLLSLFIVLSYSPLSYGVRNRHRVIPSVIGPDLRSHRCRGGSTDELGNVKDASGVLIVFPVPGAAFVVLLLINDQRNYPGTTFIGRRSPVNAQLPSCRATMFRSAYSTCTVQVNYIPVLPGYFKPTIRPRPTVVANTSAFKEQMTDGECCVLLSLNTCHNDRPSDYSIQSVKYRQRI